MEVADQWRRQWAGAAEYGKVTEGGVTRRIARAMEVLHASAPGTRVRVMRAAYHSSSGHGEPASSYLMHSSRRVISSGYNLPEPSSLPSKPLEVSSLPLESSPDIDSERLNYKVTEPDDIEISQPSKWKNATGNNIRMPSEESSSADNASIIDLDSRNSSRNTFTRSRDSESNEDTIRNIHLRNNRVSPLLDAPVTLSTLKYTSLLNGSDEWNNRRKSYSFEDTSTLNNNGSLRDTSPLVMDSSTDSGICKSTEYFTDHTLDGRMRRSSREKLSDLPEESFQGWLSKNRPSTTFKPSRVSPLKDFNETYQTSGSNISLQSKGKVTITLPVMVEKDDSDQELNNENDRRAKKVGFCKTELHFAAESGTVNIIATDEKPPPTHDFRRKKSVFLPYTSKVDKSITLFGERNFELKHTIDEHATLDENTAATKSILKNRIPKPKPYLLGENMTFGNSEETSELKHEPVPTAVSLINRQLVTENNHYHYKKNNDENYYINNDLRKDNADPKNRYHDSNEKFIDILQKKQTSDISQSNKNKLSPTLGQLKTRQLRESDLTYFGIGNYEKRPEEIQTLDNLQEEILQSIKLVQKVSNSVCNSEADSDDNHDYQNISNHSYRPVPKPRTKYIDINEKNQVKSRLGPVSEKEKDIPQTTNKRYRSKHESRSTSSGSISDPQRKDVQYLRENKRESSPKRLITARLERDPKVNEKERNKKSSSSLIPGESMYVNLTAKRDIPVKNVETNTLDPKKRKEKDENDVNPNAETEEKSHDQNSAHRRTYLAQSAGSPKVSNHHSVNRDRSPKKSKETDRPVRTSSKSRKSKYVINYDDKNGTVSSICKVKPQEKSEVRRKEPAAQNKKIATERNARVAKKSGFLRTPDRHWLSNGIKQKSKTHVQKSCQLL
ncbi:unnamed protein product [Leptosia nina]|uniref:Uncharacterized protein n=1 Tax=Leptosia nina TaxID=320188 RepID=A0AAV1JTG0_9NEOP